jgi:hypothetical protein
MLIHSLRSFKTNKVHPTLANNQDNDIRGRSFFDSLVSLSSVKATKPVEMSSQDIKNQKNVLRSTSYGEEVFRNAMNRKFAYAAQKYLYVVPDIFKPFVLKVLERLVNLTEESLLVVSKEISVLALKYWFKTNNIKYFYILDLNTFTGYDTVAHNSFDAQSALSPFVTEQEVRDLEILPNVKKYIHKIKTKNVEYSFLNFVSFRDWAVGGASSHGEKVVFENIGRDGSVKALSRKDKFLALIRWSDEDIVKRCLSSKYKTKVGTFVKKDEPGKPRLVQSYDVFSFIRCSYIECFIDNINGNGDWTSLGYRARDTMSMYQTLLTFPGFRLAVDQSGFDLHQSKLLVISTIKELFDWIKLDNDNPSLNRVIDAEIDSLERVIISFGGTEKEWKYGLLSGYKFTALIGSLLNAGAFDAAMNSVGAVVKFGRFQGDDAVAINESEVDIAEVAKFYLSIGKEINVLKSWQHRRRTDYLHLLFDMETATVSGYPARIAKSLIWKKPGLESSYNKQAKINEFNSLVLKGSRRGLIYMDQVLKRYVRSQVNVKDIDLDKWIYSKTVIGGAGFGKGNYALVYKKIVGKKFNTTIKGSVELDRKWFPGFSDYLVNKYSEVLPMPGVSFEVSLKREKTPSDLRLEELKHSGQIVKGIPVPNLSWNVRDTLEDKDAYKKQLLLKSILLTREPIPRYLLPPGWFREKWNSPRLYRRLLKLFQQAKFSLDNLSNDQMLYYPAKDVYYITWRALVYQSVDLGYRMVSKVDYQFAIYSLLRQVDDVKLKF